MLETLFLAALIYLFLTRTKKKRKPRTLDAELKELIQDSNDATAISLEIKRYLLDVIGDDKESAAKFAPARINQAQQILDRRPCSLLLDDRDRSPTLNTLCRPDQWSSYQCE
jgi:hypothetical protein